MNVAFAAVIFAPALAVGSFLNVVASRLPLGQSLSRPRSKCPHCDEQIRHATTSRCSRSPCSAAAAGTARRAISWRYPAVELLGVLVAACVVVFGLSLHALAASLFCVALVAISATDLEQ